MAKRPALVGKDLLIAEELGQVSRALPSRRSGSSDKWAIVGIHVDQQHDGPDTLTGIICGLDRKPLTAWSR